MYKNIQREEINPQGWLFSNGAVPYILDIVVNGLKDEGLYDEIDTFLNSHTCLWLFEQGSYAPLYMDILKIYEIEKEKDFIFAMLSLYLEDFEEIEKYDVIDSNWVNTNSILVGVFNSLLKNDLSFEDFLGSHTYLWIKERGLNSPSVEIIIDIFKCEIEDGTFGFIQGVLKYYSDNYLGAD